MFGVGGGSFQKWAKPEPSVTNLLGIVGIQNQAIGKSGLMDIAIHHRPVGVFLSFILAIFGTIQMAMGVEILSKPVNSSEATWLLYTLEFRDAQQFYFGCALLAACLTFLCVHKCKSN